MFAQVRAKVIEMQNNGLFDPEDQMLAEDHTAHVLRHSFRTDIAATLITSNTDVVGHHEPLSSSGNVKK